MVSKFQDLHVWQKAHQLVLNIYELTKSFPKDEKFRITEQLLRAVISIPTNIAEGFGRYTTKDYIKFLTIARGSVSEVVYLLLLTKDLNYISKTDYENYLQELEEIGKMINGLINSLKTKSDKS
ncbi:Ribosomal protein S23 [Melioribacter roseus P3M-2]|uniref:Ribosomal protein S23 n=1 Tax=Melioribacter roseus (strain DSM 23840 / JCM 17771 / VKM B-2668 / P3M-2) TaxID=1191523 RepID=I6ZV88_MELRP|nr:four helix bundle protein [Melioribacter roseus]AFN75919.1 Ribosomal protein S23 [Melioribacter roseus P3M-2]